MNLLKMYSNIPVLKKLVIMDKLNQELEAKAKELNGLITNNTSFDPSDMQKWRSFLL
jgi:hypothetical protein